ncbi:phosphoribosyltransferase [Nocardia carnea]|uniref:Phosphoribosyltransferase domain-containing protein n=1 Tax=Nocardia carnea TaxID=37328 RepID=A0ABW7TVY4_9NOCA|nr:phosphoribosyltransferase [Nocardia carnea]
MSEADVESCWATRTLGIELLHRECFRHSDRPDALPARPVITDLLQPGLRKNPRRAHLLVSTVLGKHLPTDPLVVRDAADRLGDLVRGVLGEQDAVALGFAETATGLGHCVATRIDAACYLHSTRRAVPGARTLTGFEEGHSHATSHLLQPMPGDVFTAGLPLVLVDDEISTGNTALDAIAALHEFAPRTHYVLAALVDMRTEADRARFARVAADLGARIDTVCLATGSAVLPDGLVGAVLDLPEAELNPVAAARGSSTRLDLPWPQDVPDGGRHGFLRADCPAFEQAGAAAAKMLRDQLITEYPDRPVVVLAHEELMYLPLCLAVTLADSGIPVRYQTTTRSPAYVLDEPGYPLRRGFRFQAPEPGEEQPRFLYNACWPDTPAAGADPVLVFVVDTPGDSAQLYAPGGLVDVLTAAGSDVLVAVVPGADPVALEAARTRATGAPDSAASARRQLSVPSPGERAGSSRPESGAPAQPEAQVPSWPEVDVSSRPDTEVLARPESVAPSRPAVGIASGPTAQMVSRSAPAGGPRPLYGPGFGSYARDDVAWLLKDLSDAELEADLVYREQRIQAGVAHYAESLPIEYQPDAAYRELFDRVLDDSAQRLALAVGTVAELVVAERGTDIVLASLARAGTPIGILIRRWLAAGHGSRRGLDIPHYAVSIVRDRGIDTVALDYLAGRHNPADVVFVDGWTGKGAIAKELTEALDAYHAAGGARFDPDLAVLADPGHCVRTYGTRDDFLIASACLNSTVSGLVSRTVLNRDLIGPDDFHGAKFYADLAADDVSGRLVDTVTAAFDTVRDRVTEQVGSLRTADRTPTWAGWASVEQVRAEYGIDSVNFVKPGVGETTRVLLRRVPWRVLVREPDAAEHAHIRLLAQAREVLVEVVPELAYSCMGLIKDVRR